MGSQVSPLVAGHGRGHNDGPGMNTSHQTPETPVSVSQQQPWSGNLGWKMAVLPRHALHASVRYPTQDHLQRGKVDTKFVQEPPPLPYKVRLVRDG